MTSKTDSPVGFSPDLTRNLHALGWRHVELLDRVGSTNAHALEAAVPWHLVAAHEQFAGRGRLDRRWSAPAGTSVALSVTVPLPRERAAWGWVPLFVGSAVRQACRSLAPDVEVWLKWPNDVLARDGESWHKLSGILCQARPDLGVPLVVVGVGLNVSQTRAQLPVPTATSLGLLGATTTRDEAVVELAGRLYELAATWDDASVRAAARDDVRAHCATIGADVVVHTADGHRREASAVGIDDEGRLLTRVPGSLSDPTPRVVPYSVADIEHVRASER